MMYLHIYRLFSLLLHPFLPFYLRWRASQSKEDPIRIKERFGHASLPKPNAPLIWIHAASMGESQSVLPLIARWQNAYPDIRILLTTVTVTSARHMINRLPDNAFHQYAPLDTVIAMKRFLRYWQPEMACFVDSELWPNMIHSLHERGIPLVLLNGRISERSARRWHYVRSFCELLLGRFTHIFAKSDEDTKRFTNLGATQAVSYGNMKFSSPALPADSKIMGELITLIQDRPVWLAASTHPGEEQMIGEIHQHMKDDFPGLLTIIVPRHSDRGDDVCAELEAQSLKVAQRSHQDAMSDDIDVYVADTMGELGVFYRIASLVFIGGSLVPHGGQNPMEPARLDCAITYGPHMHNFTEFCHELEGAGGAIAVNDAAHLQEVLKRLLRDQEQQNALAQAALQVAEQNMHVMDDIDQALEPILHRITGAAPLAEHIAHESA